MNIGVRVNVLEKFGDGWWKVMIDNVENEQQQTIGLYPSNYLQEEANNASINGSSNAKNVKICNCILPKPL